MIKNHYESIKNEVPSTLNASREEDDDDCPVQAKQSFEGEQFSPPSLPSMHLVKSKWIGDSEVEKAELTVTGYNLEDCAAGINFLADKLKELNGSDVKK